MVSLNKVGGANAQEETRMADPSPALDDKTEDRAGDAVPPAGKPEPREVGGRPGPDPTRYIDWEKGGRCVDF
jgi:hypothetical protein